MAKDTQKKPPVALANETAAEVPLEEDESLEVAKYKVLADAYGPHKRNSLISPEDAAKIGLSLTDAVTRGFLQPLDSEGRVVVEELAVKQDGLQEELARAARSQSRQISEFKSQVTDLLQKMAADFAEKEADYQEKIDTLENRVKVLEDTQAAKT